MAVTTWELLCMRRSGNTRQHDAYDLELVESIGGASEEVRSSFKIIYCVSNCLSFVDDLYCLFSSTFVTHLLRDASDLECAYVGHALWVNGTLRGRVHPWIPPSGH